MHEMRTLQERHEAHATQQKQREMETQSASDEGEGFEFKPQVIQVDGGIDKAKEETYGGDYLSAGWSLRVQNVLAGGL